MSYNTEYIALMILGFGLVGIISFAVYDLSWENISQEDKDKWNNDQVAWENNKPLAILLVGGFLSILWIIPLILLVQSLRKKNNKKAS